MQFPRHDKQETTHPFTDVSAELPGILSTSRRNTYFLNKARSIPLTIKLLFVSICLPVSLQANTAVVKKPTPPASGTLLLNAWYTISIEKGKPKPYGYYHDEVSKQEGKVIFKNQVWKKEVDLVTQESLWSFAKDDENLTPLFFDFNRQDSNRTTQIHGEIQILAQNKQEILKLNITGSEAAQGKISAIPNPARTLPVQTFFSTHFPVWLKRHSRSIAINQTLPFHFILEDNAEIQFRPLYGRVTHLPQDAEAKTLKAEKFSVQYEDQRSLWYIGPDGFAERIDVINLKAVVRRVPESVAKSFLK